MINVDRLIREDAKRRRREKCEDGKLERERQERVESSDLNDARYALGCFFGDGGMSFDGMRWIGRGLVDVDLDGYSFRVGRTEVEHRNEAPDTWEVLVEADGEWVVVYRPTELKKLKKARK